MNERKPKEITVDRAKGILQITWGDEHVSDYPLRWLRANCPCATCKEERRAATIQAAVESTMLSLHSGPLPSTEIRDAKLVGNYAVQFEWTDGHGTGIYAFSSLRSSCPCSSCNPAGPLPLLPE